MRLRSPMAARTNSSSSRSPGDSSQSSHENLVVLAVGIVVPALGAAEFVPGQQHRHALRAQQGYQELRFCLARSRVISGLPVRPSTPQFHDLLSSLPSRPPSPFASLCLRL